MVQTHISREVILNDDNLTRVYLAGVVFTVKLRRS